MFVSVLVRRLRKDKSYSDFRDAWYPDKGFDVPVRVQNARRLDNPREIISIGFIDLPSNKLNDVLNRIAGQEAVRHKRLEAVIEKTVLSGIYEIVDEDDLMHL